MSSGVISGGHVGGANAAAAPASTWNKVSERQLSLSVGAGFTIFCGICVIWSKKLAAFMSMFLRLQLPVDVPESAKGSGADCWMDCSWYRLGWTDLLTVLCYTIIALIATSCLEDFVLVRMFRNADGSESDETHELSRLVVNSAFNVLTVVHAALSIAYGHIEWWNVWNGYDKSHMPFVGKMFFMSQIAFWLHATVYNIEYKREEAASLPTTTKISFHLTFLSLAFVFKNSIIPTIVGCMIIHAVLDLIDNLGEICRRMVPDNEVLNIALNAVYKYMNIAESFWLIVVSLIMASKGETDLLALRLVTVIASLGWAIFVVLNCYLDYDDDMDRPMRPVGRANATRSVSGNRPGYRANSPARRNARACRRR